MQAAAAAPQPQHAVDACIQGAAEAMHGGTRWVAAASTQSAQPAGVIGLVLRRSELGMVVEESISGGPGHQAGLREEAQLLQVDGKALIGKTVAEAVSLIRGEPGTPVRLLWLDTEGTERETTLTRAELPAPKLAHAINGWVYLRPPLAAAENLTRQLLGALRPLHAALREGLVLDLRGHGGGQGQDMADLAALFLPCGQAELIAFSPGGLRSELGEAPDRQFQYGDEPIRPTPKNLVVLLDAGTGNGAAWVADALRRQAGALLVGEPSASDFRTRLGLRVGGDGARFELPHGELLAIHGLPLHDHPIEPDVHADSLGPPRTGQPPHGLAAWLRDQWPVIRQRSSTLHPTLAGSSRDSTGLCAGLSRSQAPIGKEMRLRSGRLRVEDAGPAVLFWDADLASNEPHPFEQARLNRVAALDADLANLVNKIQKAPRAKAAALRHQQRALLGQRQAIWLKELRGMQLIHISANEHGLLWKSGDEWHQLSLHLDQTVDASQVLAAYTSVAQRIRPRGDSTNASICLGSFELHLASTPLELSWDASWEVVDPQLDPMLPTPQLHLWGETRRAIAGDARQPSSAADLFKPPDRCNGQRPTRLSRQPVAGQTGMVMHWDSDPRRPSQCKAVRVALPAMIDPDGNEWVAHATLSGWPASGEEPDLGTAWPSHPSSLRVHLLRP